MQRVLITLLVAGCCVTSLMANPSHDDPSRALGAHGTIEGAQELVESLYELYNTELKVAIKLQDTPNPARLPYAGIAKASGRIWKGKRDAEHLKLMGEPAGYDLAAKLNMLGIEFKKLGLAYKNTQPGGALHFKLKKQLDASKARDGKKLQQLGAAFTGGGSRETLEPKMGELEAYGIKLYEKMAFFSPTESNPYVMPLDTVAAAADTALTPLRRTAYAETAQAAMKTNLAAVQNFTTEATRIRGEIAANGTATLGEGVTGDVVQAFAHLVGVWGDASAALTRIAGLQWAFGSSGLTASELSAPARDEARKLGTTAEKSLAQLIEAAVATTPSDKLVSTYSALLEQIATADRRTDSSSLASACASSLAKLAAKDPALPKRIENYQRATTEVLAWRNRFAEQQAKELQKKYPVAVNQLTRKESVTKSNRPKLFGGVARAPRPVAPNVFGAPAEWTVYEAGSLLVGQPFSDKPMIRLSPVSKTAVIPHRDSHFVNVPVPMPSENEVADLKQALLFDANNPPLTMEAADALSSAALHDYERVGGQIYRVRLESAVTRFASLKSGAYPLVALGKIPVIREDSSPLTQTCWRLDAMPHWAQNKYFVVKVQPQTQ